MAEVERITTLHPEGKQGVNIERAKYEDMRGALLQVIPADQEGVPFKELSRRVEPLLDPRVYVPGVSCIWFVTTVKQDLEARGLIEQVPRAKPQRLRRPDKQAPRA